MSAPNPFAVQKTPGVCGGRACLHGTRIPVWLVVLKRQFGEPDDHLLRSYPDLTPAHLDAAWDYYREHPVEIEQDIWWNDTAANVPDGEPVPAGVIVDGKLLGLDDTFIRESFDPPLPAEAVASAWAEYRADPARFGRPTLTRQVG